MTPGYLYYLVLGLVVVEGLAAKDIFKAIQAVRSKSWKHKSQMRIVQFFNQHFLLL